MSDEPMFVRGYGWVKGEKMRETLMARAKAAITRNNSLEKKLDDMSNRAGKAEVCQLQLTAAIRKALAEFKANHDTEALKILNKAVEEYGDDSGG